MQKTVFRNPVGPPRPFPALMLRIMKLQTVFFFVACMSVSAKPAAQTITLSGKDLPMKQIFSSIEKQTDFVVFFNARFLDASRPVSLNVSSMQLRDFLFLIEQNQPFFFRIEGKTISLVPKAAPPPGTATDPGPPAPVDLILRVLDEAGNPLPGASVKVKGTKTGTATDAEGYAILKGVENEKVTLEVSYIGYQTKEVKFPEGLRQFFVGLAVAVNVLDEEVVQAYGKTSQRLAVGNIVKISGEEIRKQPVMNPLLALNGRVPGVLITPTSGYLSAPVKVEVRGRNTINETLVADPLYVIDGVPLTILDINTSFNSSNYKNGSTGFFQAGLFSNTQGQSPLFSINPADIESISVLKDAAATAIYGSRGANGVIIITTNRTKPGMTRLNVNVQQAVSAAPKHWDMLNTSQYLQMRREALKNDGLPVNIANMPELGWDTTRSTDWQEEFWGLAKSTEATVGLSGGNHNTAFNLGAGYNESQDITTLSGKNQRINISSNVTHHSSNQKLTIDLRTLYSYTYVKAITSPNLVTLPPNAAPIFDKKGALNYADWTAVGLNYPFAQVLQPSTNSNNFLNAGLRINYHLVKELNLSINAGYSNAQSNSTWFNPIAAQNPLLNPTGNASFGNSTINNWNIEPQLNYAVHVGGGMLDVMAGGTYQSSSSKGINMTGYGYTNDALLKSISNAPFVSSGQQIAEKKYISVHGRINYNWQNRYILEVTGNRDGSSNFGPGKQFGNFWSAGGAWIASEETWAKNLLPSWWSFLKLNASYGVTGLDAGGAYKYLTQWSAPKYTGYDLGNYNGVAAMISQQAVNADYQWQENRKINADLSMGFLKDQITLTVSWYRNRCDNQLTTIPLPSYTGFTSVLGNSPANVENSGWEGNLNANIIATKALSWTVGFNIGINRNRLLSYPDFEFSPFYTRKKIGASLNTEYLLGYLGVNPQNGRYSYADYNHDGIITQNSGVPPGTLNDDKYVVVDVTPKYSGGISNQLSYKNLMLSVFFNFKKQLRQLPFTGIAGQMSNIPIEVYNNHWQKPGDQTIYPRFTTQQTISDTRFASSDGSYVDGSFVRLSSLALSYSLPKKLCQKMYMQGVNLSLNMGNVFTITSYKGIDPEITFGTLPLPRTIAGRVSFNF
jgi:TonB-linked SusC/RagA family outer membrane protein